MEITQWLPSETGSFCEPNFGPVQAKITDPVLELYDPQNSLIASNDDWQTGSNLVDLNRRDYADQAKGSGISCQSFNRCSFGIIERKISEF